MGKSVGRITSDYRDVGRYLDRVVEAIRKNLPNIIANIDASLSPGGGKVRVRIPDVEPYWFRPYAPESGGMGRGGSGPGEGSEGGLVVEVDLEDLKEMVWEWLKLPNLDPRRTGEVESGFGPYGYTRKGPPSRLSLKRTLREQIRSGGLIHNNIFRYRDLREKREPSTSAVVVLIRDRSGSITDERVYIMRVASWWIVEWLRRNYSFVDLVFIVHDYEAVEVDEKEFFFLTSGGGTLIRSAMEKGWSVLEERYPHHRWNRYMVYFGDGEGSLDDLEESAKMVDSMKEGLELFAYGEVNEGPPLHFERRFYHALEEKFPRERRDRVRFGRMGKPEDVSEWLRVCFAETEA